ncbi:hypothetical protein ABW12_11750 [Pluralibacter gergoviae]|nr:hypothetical protein ABW12_11750 [Pluralibacter gergoviae]
MEWRTGSAVFLVRLACNGLELKKIMTNAGKAQGGINTLRPEHALLWSKGESHLKMISPWRDFNDLEKMAMGWIVTLGWERTGTEEEKRIVNSMKIYGYSTEEIVATRNNMTSKIESWRPLGTPCLWRYPDL